jgi:Mce-associated membrane protein
MMRPGTKGGITVADKDSNIEEQPTESAESEVVDESAADAKSVESEVADESATGGASSDSKVADESATVDAAQEPAEAKDRRISVSVRTLVVGAVIVSLIAAVAVMTWLYIGANTKLDDQARQAGGSKHAEQVALDYAVDAAVIDFQNLGTWKKNLVKGVTPELKEKLNKAAEAMDQILTPLQWNSTAKPLAAKTRSNANGIYIVDAFVSVMTKTTQAPTDSLQSTATYSVTIDSNHDWQITDVGGIGSMVGEK